MQKRIAEALREDIGSGDITSGPIFSRNRKGSCAELMAKEHGVVAGMKIARIVCRLVDPSLRFTARVAEGDRVHAGQKLAEIDGSALSLLLAERTLLNFMQRLSGIATLTRRYVDAVKGTRAVILDTRKTTPLWRDLEKTAVRLGGGKNHRMGLYDQVLIKDNHIDAAGGIAPAVAAVRKRRKRQWVEVETRNLDEVREAYQSGCQRILLDNMTFLQMKTAVSWLKKQKKPVPQTEASGGITLANVRSVAQTDVDFISIGALTHSAPALDLSLKINRKSV